MTANTVDTPAPDVAARRFTPLEALTGVLLRPRHTFARMREASRGHWWVVLALALAGLIITTIATVPLQVAAQQAAFEATQEQFEDLPPEQLAQIEQTQAIFSSTAMLGVIGTLTGIVTLLIGYVVRAGVLFLLGLALGGQASFRQVWRMAVWTTLPVVIGGLVTAAATIITGGMPAQGLSYIFTSAELAEASPILLAILNRIDLYTLWSLVLIALGMVGTARLSGRKAALVAAVFWLLGTGGAAALAAIGQAITRSFGMG